MNLLNSVLLLQMESLDLPQKLVEASPYNPAVYGLLVLIGYGLAWLFWHNWRKAEEYNRERDKQVVDLQKESIAIVIENTEATKRLGERVDMFSKQLERIK